MPAYRPPTVAVSVCKCSICDHGGRVFTSKRKIATMDGFKLLYGLRGTWNAQAFGPVEDGGIVNCRLLSLGGLLTCLIPKP